MTREEARSAVMRRPQSRIPSRFAVPLLIGGLMSACGGSPAGIDDRIPTYGSCAPSPNYIEEVRLNRWRSFPLTYFFDAVSFPEDFRQDYRSAILTGLSRWDQATGNELGALVEVTNRTEADFSITYRPVSPSSAPSRTFHSTGTPFLAGGEIAFNASNLGEVEQRVRAGALSRETFLFGLSSISAHEAGHLFGIIGHPDGDDTLMGSSRPPTLDAPTVADVNTLVHAYCQP